MWRFDKLLCFQLCNCEARQNGLPMKVLWENDLGWWVKAKNKSWFQGTLVCRLTASRILFAGVAIQEVDWTQRWFCKRGSDWREWHGIENILFNKRQCLRWLKTGASENTENMAFKRGSLYIPSTGLLTCQMTQYSLLMSFNSLPKVAWGVQKRSHTTLVSSLMSQKPCGEGMPAE